MTSKTQKRARRDGASKLMAELVAVGVKVRVMEAKSMQWRATGPAGRVLDLYVTTEVWRCPQGSAKGVGLSTFMAAITKAPNLPKVTKASKAVAVAASRVDLALFADASRCQKTGASGWGVWIKGAGMSAGMTAGGPLKDVTTGSTQAELYAIINGLWLAKKHGILKAGHIVMIQSDSICALSIILHSCPKAQNSPAPGGLAVRQSKRRPKPDAAVVLMREIAEEFDLRILVRHVPGHKAGEGRAWVNRRCDELAKIGMRAARAEQFAERPFSTSGAEASTGA